MKRREFLAGTAVLLVSPRYSRAQGPVGDGSGKKDLVANYGGKGDGQRQTVIATMAAGSPNLTVDAAIFVSADQGKAITLWWGGASLTTIIKQYNSPIDVVLSANATRAISSVSTDILWGTDNTPAFFAFRAFALTQSPGVQVTLTIPDGRYCLRTGPFALPNKGLRNVKWQGSSMDTCIISQLHSGEFRFGGDPPIKPNAGLDSPGANSARLQTAAASATSVTLVDAARYGSRIVVGRYCLIAAFDVQGLNGSYYGYPPNNFFYEWNVITGFNPATGVITLQTPLTQGYKSTYPEWGPRTTIFGSDQGGPATIWVAPADYDATVELADMTIDNPHNQSACHTRDVVVRRCKMMGPALYPTQNKTFFAESCVYPNQLEVDKMTDTVTFNDCTLKHVLQQSASPNRLILNRGTIETLGTAKYTEANDVTFVGAGNIEIGVLAYGRSDRLVMNNCSGIHTYSRMGAATDDLGGSNGPTAQTPASTFYAFVGGVIKFLKTQNNSAGGKGQQNLTRCFVPGTWVTFDDKYMDQVVDVWEDGTHCYVQFANTTNWPFTPVQNLFCHPMPDLTVRNCSGTLPILEDWNQAPARTPIYGYAKKTYVAGAASGSILPASTWPIVWGRPTSIKTTVSSVFTGTSLSFLLNQFTNWKYIRESDHVQFANFGETISMKVAGVRTMTNASLPAGGVAGDTLFNFATTGSVWFFGSGSSPIFSANVTNGDTPTVTVEWIMDQGIS